MYMVVWGLPLRHFTTTWCLDKIMMSLSLGLGPHLGTGQATARHHTSTEKRPRIQVFDTTVAYRIGALHFLSVN